MSAWVCPDRGHETRMSRWVNDRFELIANRYGALMDFSLRWRWQLIAAGLFFTLLITPLYLFSLKELSPVEGPERHQSGGGFRPGVIYGRDRQGFSDAVEVLMERPETTYIWQALGPSGGYGGHEFVPPGERNVTTHELMLAISEQRRGRCQQLPRFQPPRRPFPPQGNLTWRWSSRLATL